MYLIEKELLIYESRIMVRLCMSVLLHWKKRFENALNKFPHKDNVEVIYKAYQLNPNAPKEMVGNAAESFAKGHGTTVTGAEEKFKMFTTNALTVGLEYRYDIIQLTNTFDAHRVAKWAGTTGQEALVTERFMKA